MDKIIGVVSGIPLTKGRVDDDFADRLSYRYTASMLVVFAIVVSTKQYVGDPIQCWVPAHFTPNHEEYTNDFCWIRNTYYLPYDDYVPKEHEGRRIIPYYQWIPLILLVQALCFYLPIVQWRSFNDRSGIDVNHLVDAGKKFAYAEHAEKRMETLQHMARVLNRYLFSQKSMKTSCTLSLKHLFSRTCCCFVGRKYGSFLVTLYLFVKALMLTNVLAQLFLLDSFMGMEFHAYGFHVLASVLQGEDWTTSARFPRITMCDLKVRRLGNVQRYTIQCVLPINLFNEKIYLFVWFWMIFVVVATAASFLTWILRIVFRLDRYRYVKKHLKMADKIQSDWDRKYVVKFVDDYLRQDGVLIVRLIGHNTNALTVTEFVCCLWELYKSRCLAIEKTFERKDPEAL